MKLHEKQEAAHAKHAALLDTIRVQPKTQSPIEAAHACMYAAEREPATEAGKARAIELHAAVCDFAAEAHEGLQGLGFPSRIFKNQLRLGIWS